jgi:glycogen(starch) synthase
MTVEPSARDTNKSMKVVMTSERLPPKTGGISTVAGLLNTGLSTRGHEIAIVTTDADSPELIGTTPVLKLSRIGSWWQYYRLLRSVDVVLQNNISAKTLLLPLIMQKRVVTALHIWLETPAGLITWRERIKFFLLRRCTKVVTPNLEITNRIGCDSTYVTNGYDESVFNVTSSWDERDDAFVVVARLVTEKGIHELIKAFASISACRPTYRLNIIGTGPEESRLKALASSLGISAKVFFLGALEPRQVSEVLNNSRVMCVPSLWDEVFGIVVLEGMGCGLPVVATAKRGLADAQNGFGILVDPNNMRHELGQAMLKITESRDTPLEYLIGVDSYLRTRDRQAMVDAYESALAEACVMAVK